MYSGLDTFYRHPEIRTLAFDQDANFKMSKVGFPIRKSTDRRLFAPSRSLSQRTTSFIASYRQGIHQMPLGHLIALISNAHRIVEALARRSDRQNSSRTSARCALHRKTRSQSGQTRTHPLACASLRAPPHRNDENQIRLREPGRQIDALGIRRPCGRQNRLIPSSRCQTFQTAGRSLAELVLPQMRTTSMVEPDGIEPTTSSLQS